MTALLIGYARCSTDQRDLTVQRDDLAALGVADNVCVFGVKRADRIGLLGAGIRAPVGGYLWVLRRFRPGVGSGVGVLDVNWSALSMALQAQLGLPQRISHTTAA